MAFGSLYGNSYLKNMQLKVYTSGKSLWRQVAKLCNYSSLMSAAQFSRRKYLTGSRLGVSFFQDFLFNYWVKLF
jgi:hypothetical protein